MKVFSRALLFIFSLAVIAEGLSDPYYDVHATGAKGDGVTDDTAPIQQAIDNAAAAGGGTVLIRSATYVIRESRKAISPFSTGAGATGSATLLLKHNVKVECLSGARLNATGTFTDAVIRAWSRDDNNQNNWVQTGMSGCTIFLNTDSPIAAIDATGMWNTTFRDIAIGGMNLNQTAMVISDITPGGYSKSCFFNRFEKIHSISTLGTWIKWKTARGNAGLISLEDHQANVNIVIDTSGGGEPGSGIFSNSYFSAAGANSTVFKPKPQVGLVGINFGAEGFATPAPSGWAQSLNVPSANGFDGLGPAAAFIGGLTTGANGLLAANNQSVLNSLDVLSPFVVNGCQIVRWTSTSVGLGGECVLYNRYRMEVPTGNAYAFAASTPGSTHTEYVYADQQANTDPYGRIHIATAIPNGGLPLASVLFNADSTVKTITDTRRMQPRFTNGVTASGKSCTITAITGGLITGATCN